MELRRYNLNTFAKQCELLIIMQHINTEHKYLQHTKISYTVFTDLAVSHIYYSMDYGTCSVLFVFWYHSPNILDTPHICDISSLRLIT
jgi:hypothetical protein